MGGGEIQYVQVGRRYRAADETHPQQQRANGCACTHAVEESGLVYKAELTLFCCGSGTQRLQTLLL